MIYLVRSVLDRCSVVYLVRTSNKNLILIMIMKLFLICLLGFVALSAAVPAPSNSRGCIYALGKCVKECPEGTHAYTTGCSYKIPEPTCDEQSPVQEKYIICDYSSCYCDPPTIRDTKSGKCVLLENCPKK